MSGGNSDSSPEEMSTGVMGRGENVFKELGKMKEVLVDKEKEINRLQREIHKLKSVIEKSELTRIPSLSSYQQLGNIQKKLGISGEPGILPQQVENESEDNGGITNNEASERGASPMSNASTANDLIVNKVVMSPPERHNKDFRTKQLIRTALSDNDFLQNLDPDQVRDIVDFMYPKKFNAGDFVITEGDEGAQLFVSSEGKLQVSQDSRNLGIIKPGVAFGELALLYNCKRTASIMAITECKTFVLERKAFKMVMVKAGMQRIKDRMSFLKSVPLLKHLPLPTLARIADCLEVENYPEGHVIIRENGYGNTFYIISQGRVRVTVSDLSYANIAEGDDDDDDTESESTSNVELTSPTGAKMHVLRELSQGDYFGEQALLREEKRSANVIAVSNVEVLTLDRESFMQLIGDLGEFNRLRKPAHFASCSQLTFSSHLSSSPSGKTPLLEENEEKKSSGIVCTRSGDGSGGAEHLSQSLPNSSFDVYHHHHYLTRTYIGGAEYNQQQHQDNFDYDKVELEGLEFIATLGVGGFGRVELVKYDSTKVFALKCLPKLHIISTQQQDHVYAEKNIMMSCNSPFIARLYKTFRDAKFVYMLMEACLGGEVWTVLREKTSFNETTSRFIAGCVLQALEYLHEREIVYRDLKPENLMFANDGYIKLVDFGFSKVVKGGERTWTFCGTPEYCSPEIVLNRGHDKLTDLWSLGILLFELLTGYPPYGPHSAENVLGGIEAPSDPLDTYNAILKGIDSVKFPKCCSKPAVSLIRRLCKQSPGERIGARNIRDIASHRWFQGFDWEGLKIRKLPPPIIPVLKNPCDVSNFDSFDAFEIQEYMDDLSGWDNDF